MRSLFFRKRKNHIFSIALCIFLAACFHGSIDKGTVTYDCGFNIQNYLKEPNASSADTLARAILWVKRNVRGGMKGAHGKQFITQLEAQFRSQKRLQEKPFRYEKVWGIGSKVTKNDLGAYILLMDRDNGFRLVEISEKDEARFQIEPDKIKLLIKTRCSVSPAEFQDK